MLRRRAAGLPPSRRAALTCATVVVAALVVTPAGCSRTGDGHAPRNVVVITVDTLRQDHLGYAGYPRDTSPTIDRFSTGCLVFQNALVQWPKTTPSVTSMMSSTYARSNGVRRVCGQRVPDDLMLLSEILSDAGYETAAVVSNRFLGGRFGFDRGFEQFVEMWHGRRDDAEAVTSEALRWLRTRDSERAFFLWVHYLDPHAPYDPPGTAADTIFETEPADGSVKLSFADDDRDVGVVPRHARIEGRDDLAFYVARYDAEIRFLDDALGDLLGALDSPSLARSTMVVLTADHGESLGDHDYFFEHGRFPYDACLRVPLLFRVPWLEVPDETVVEPVDLLAVAPTILEAIGESAPDSFQGRSLLPLFSSDRSVLPEAVFAEAGYSARHQIIVRQGRWKLISVPDPEDRTMMAGAPYELYDVEADPEESRNRAAEHPEVVSRLTSLLTAWQNRLALAPEAETVDLEIEERSALEALGYAEEARSS